MRHRIFIIGILIFGVSLFMTSPAAATDSQVQVSVGDECPNIPGNQLTMPTGMQHDQDGNCYTPTPPPPPDACPNIDGQQSAIPEGFYRNSSGNCVAQTKPPKDICPNLDGTQSSVPFGMQTASDGACMWPQADVCPNIPGPQDPIPEGMAYDSSGDCQTPAPPNAPTGVGKPGAAAKPHPFQALPYYLIAALVFVSLLLLAQMLRESLKTRGTIFLFKRRKRIAEEKDAFVAVTTNYLNTTVAAMLASLASHVSLGERSDEEVAPLMQATQALQTDIETAFAHKPSESLEAANMPTRNALHVKTLRSLLFWLPTAVTALGLIAINLLLTHLTFSDNDTWMQLIAFIAAVALLFFTLRMRHVRHLRRQSAEKLIENEQAIDISRNTFIVHSAIALGKGLQKIDLHRHLIAQLPSSKLFHESYSGLTSILEKLSLLRLVAAGAGQPTTFDIRDAIDNCLLRYQMALDAKKLSLTDTVEHHSLTQNRRLFDFVLMSVLENAIRYNTVGGSISIATARTGHKLEIRFTNSDGVPLDKQAQLFQPLTDPAPEGNATYSGIGLSLFLDRIIMDHLGGDIAIRSVPGHETTVTLRI